MTKLVLCRVWKYLRHLILSLLFQLNTYNKVLLSNLQHFFLKIVFTRQTQRIANGRPILTFLLQLKQYSKSVQQLTLFTTPKMSGEICSQMDFFLLWRKGTDFFKGAKFSLTSQNQVGCYICISLFLPQPIPTCLTFSTGMLVLTICSFLR